MIYLLFYAPTGFEQITSVTTSLHSLEHKLSKDPFYFSQKMQLAISPNFVLVTFLHANKEIFKSLRMESFEILNLHQAPSRRELSTEWTQHLASSAQSPCQRKRYPLTLGISSTCEGTRLLRVAPWCSHNRFDHPKRACSRWCCLVAHWKLFEREILFWYVSENCVRYFFAKQQVCRNSIWDIYSSMYPFCNIFIW